MPDAWTGNLVGKMHNNGVTRSLQGSLALQGLMCPWF